MNTELVKNHYLVVPNFIDKDEADILASFIKRTCDKGDYVTDPQAYTSPSVYNKLPLVRLLVAKIPEVSKLCGEEVLPTYVYARQYAVGAVLKRHIDRPACEISLTVNLRGEEEWPIWVQKPNGQEVSVNLQPGDAMLYLGCVAEHWRDKFTGSGDYIQTFMHYVRSYGPNAWCFFDKERIKHENTN